MENYLISMKKEEKKINPKLPRPIYMPKMSREQETMVQITWNEEK